MSKVCAGLLLLGALALAGAAEATHITDKLAVGLYDSPGDETPARVLTSGTPLEILDRGKRFCQVRLGDGDSGWLECRYATDEKPARAMLLEAQAGAGQLRNQMEEQKQQLEAQQLRLQELELRLRGAERLVGEQEAGPGEGESEASMDSATAKQTEQSPGNPPAKRDSGLLLALLGTAGGFALGALLLFWRCRRGVSGG